MPRRGDPRTQALTKFASSAPWAPQLDVITRYATDPPLAIANLVGAVEERVAPGARVCELGFGSGWLLEQLARRVPQARLHGLDMSAAALADARAKFGGSVALTRGDMERLPFRDNAFDVIATCWTLYFMNDIARVLSEIRRCTVPGGRVVAATVAPDHMREYDELVAESMRAALDRSPEPDVGLRFDLDSGAPYMQRAFEQVELREWRGTMDLPDVETALAIWHMYGPQLSDPGEDAAVRGEFASRVANRIARDGALRITRHDGAFVADV
jgi:SAM-dependent methyltransferase